METIKPAKILSNFRSNMNVVELTIALNGRDVLPIEEQINIAEVRRWTAVDHHLVQHQNVCGRQRADGRHLRDPPVVSVLVLLLLVLPHDDAAQATAKRQRRVAFQHVRHLLLKVVELEWSQEAQRAQVERHDGRHRLLEQQRGVQQRPIATQADDEVDAIGEVVAAVSKMILKN